MRFPVGLSVCCLLAGFLTTSCVSTGPSVPPVQMKWPEPPLVTRVEHLRTLSGPGDLGRQVSRWESFVNYVVGTRTRFWSIAHPVDVETNADASTVYVSDFALGLVHVFDLRTNEVSYIGKQRRLARPFGLALDSLGNLYIVEQELRQIRLVRPDGQTLRIFQSERLIRPADLALDEERGRLYVADTSHQDSPEHFVRIFDLDGNYLGEIGAGRGFGDGQLLFPTYLALDGEGRIYVSDTMNSRVAVFDADGRFLRTIGTRGDGFGQFDKPKGVALDSHGNLYVVDSSWSHVQIFGPEDHVLLYFGGRGSYPGLLKNPTAIAIAESNNTILVGDYLNRRVGIYRLVNTSPGDGLPSNGTEGGKQ
jgi:DNA-binding beta-propeller fold protein YncE